MRVVAAFDFDGTVSEKEAVVTFCSLVIGKPRLALTYFRNAHHGFAAFRDRRKRDDFKALLAAAVFTNRSVAEVEDIAARFAETHMSTIRPSMIERIEWHRNQGHEVVFASASFEPYLHPIARQLKVDTVLGTRLVVDGDRYTGQLDGRNIRAQAKADAVKGHAGDAELWAYGNSSDDYPMFEIADHAFYITKSGEMQPFNRPV